MADFLGEKPQSVSNSQDIMKLKADLRINDTPLIKVEAPDKAALIRMHIQIRQDLMDKLLYRVFERKRDPAKKGAATQRAIVEEALESYFTQAEAEMQSQP